MNDPPLTYTGPALVDLQLNGYAGFDFNSDPAGWTPDDFDHVKQALHRRGVYRALPTIITDEIPQMLARVRRYVEIVEQHPELGQTFPLLHVEGPFISPEEGPRGAHPRAHCTTPEQHPQFLSRLVETSNDRIGLFTLASELRGAMSLIESARREGLCVALGHTEASPETIQQAVNQGAQLSTHLGNGSHQMLPRLDNYVQVQLAEDRLAASFIADGHHMPFYTLKNFIRAKTPARSILITDAMAAAEQGPGLYHLGSEEVVVTPEGRVSKPGDPNLAGSALTLDRAVINTARHCDISFSTAWNMASRQPADLLGITELPQISVEVEEKQFSSVTVQE